VKRSDVFENSEIVVMWCVSSGWCEFCEWTVWWWWWWWWSVINKHLLRLPHKQSALVVIVASTTTVINIIA